MSNFFSTEFKKLESLVETDVDDAESELAPILALAKTKGVTEGIQIGETVLAGAATGTPWATLTASFVAELAKEGVQLAEQVASAVLNLAQANLLAKTATPAA